MQSKIDFLLGINDDVTQLLKKGMPIDLKDDNGNTVLMIVVKVMAVLLISRRDYIGIVNQLISMGVDLNARNREGKTALSLAFECGALASAITTMKTRETVLAKASLEEDELEDIEEELREEIEYYHAKQTTQVITILLANNAHFTQEEGYAFYNKLLTLDLNNEGIYTCLRMIEKRFAYPTHHGYPALLAYLRNIDWILNTQRQPLYLALQATQFFADDVIKIITQYEDPLANNYLMKSDVQKIFSRGQCPGTETITAILQKGLFRSPVVQADSNPAPISNQPS